MKKNSTHTLIIRSKRTGEVLRRFEYPSKKIPGKFYWEKIKLEELTKLLKARDITADSVITEEHIDS